MLEWLINLVTRLGPWGYVIVFMGATLESAALLGLLVPGESLVVLSGFLAAQGVFDLTILIPLVCVGAILGDNIGYEIGRRISREGLLRYGRWVGITKPLLDRVDGFFADHGGKTVLTGRFIGFLRALAPLVAGSARMPYRRFLVYNAIGAILWSVAFLILGYFVGASWRVAQQWIGRASEILAVLLVLVILLAWLWRWLLKHEQHLKLRWAAFRRQPAVMALYSRYGPILDFLQARLTPGSYLGLRVTVGGGVILAFGWAFGLVARSVLRARPLSFLDGQIAEWFHDRHTPGLTAVMMGLTTLDSLVVVSALTTMVSLLLLLQRQWRRLLAWGLTVPGGIVLNFLISRLFDEARLKLGFLPLKQHLYWLPSRDIIPAIILYGTLAVFVVRAMQTWRARVLAVMLAVFLIVLVDFSRVYLGVQYLSDVLANNAAGVAWMALCLTAVETLRQTRDRINSHNGESGLIRE